MSTKKGAVKTIVPISGGLIEASKAALEGEPMHTTKDPIALALGSAFPGASATVGLLELTITYEGGVATFHFDEKLALWVEEFDEYADPDKVNAPKPDPIRVELNHKTHKARLLPCE